MADELVRAFREVGEIGKGAWFRGAPFWSWNDKLDPEELRRQIREFHQQGLGGFFMHARIGLDTPYMSEEWMQAVAACIDEAKKLGMLAWLYDEDKWPSGFAGGLVSGRGGDYNQKLLRVREIPVDWNMREFIPHDRSLAVYVVTRKGRQWLEWKEVTGKALNMSEHRGKVIVEFFVERSGYIDVMNPKAVEAFIRVTHDAYRERFAEEFGKTVPGIFTDEPNCNRTRLWLDGRVSPRVSQPERLRLDAPFAEPVLRSQFERSRLAKSQARLLANDDGTFRRELHQARLRVVRNEWSPTYRALDGGGHPLVANRLDWRGNASLRVHATSGN